MPVKVRIPAPFRKLTGNKSMVAGEGATVAELFANLDIEYPGLSNRVFDEEGSFRRFVNVYVNDQDALFLNGKETPLKDGDEITILPAIAGG